MSDPSKVISDEDAPTLQTPAEVEYVVQARRPIKAVELSADVPEPVTEVWVDIATVSAAPRTKRRTLISKALAEAGIKPTAEMESPRIRVLDVDSARVHEVPVVVAEPRFEI